MSNKKQQPKIRIANNGFVVKNNNRKIYVRENENGEFEIDFARLVPKDEDRGKPQCIVEKISRLKNQVNILSIKLTPEAMLGLSEGFRLYSENKNNNDPHP